MIPPSALSLPLPTKFAIVAGKRRRLEAKIGGMTPDI